MVLLVLILWTLVNHSPAVQNWLGRQVVARMSKELNTEITVKSVRFKLFNKMDITGLLIKDRNKDTLLHAGVMSVKITDWFFTKDKAELSTIDLDNVYINTYREDSVWNYQFIVDYLSGPPKAKSTSNKEGISLNLKHLLLNNTTLKQRDAWLGESKVAVIGRLELNADEIDFKRKNIKASLLDLTEPKIYFSNYKRNKPYTVADSLRKINAASETVTAPTTWNKDGWVVNIGTVVIRDGFYGQDKQTGRPVLDYFDGAHLLFNNIQARLEGLRWQGDTIRMNASIAAKERSGLNVTSLKSDIIAYPNTVEFTNLLLRTPESQVSDYLSFSFADFNKDFSDFIHAVRMNARLKNSIVSSNDLALFAPKLNQWKRKIIVDGLFRGTVDNFSGKNLYVRAGDNTSLSGNLVITGLPDVNNTFIDLSNADLKTNYNELATFVPSLKTVKGVRLAQLGRIDYNGSFTGFPKDFVTYGTLKTDLGTVVTDLNLKLGKVPAYSGKIQTAGFNIGRLTGQTQLGNLGFNGKVEGSGFDPKTINADINGTVTRLDYGGYSYSGITIKGTLAKQQFDGDIVAKDPNLDADISGVIDFGSSKPRFDLVADVRTVKFRNLNMSSDDYAITGKMNLKFAGNTVDNFDGEAHLSELTIVKNGEVIFFNQLDIASTSENGVKQININNSQFDATVTGQFNYAGLANSVGFFLNRYYPNIFRAPKNIARNQDFDFKVTTRDIQPYLALVNKDLRGFNNSEITGSVNTNDNTLTFNAKVPEGGFRTYNATDLAVTGTGTIDSLNLSLTAGVLSITDSIQFVNTQIGINTGSDQSRFNIVSRGEGSLLSDVDISGMVTTYDDGIMANFNPSFFTINGRKWTMENNGELILRKDVVNAQGIRFTHAQQEIAIRSEPDPEGGHYNLIANLKDFELGDFAPLVVPGNKIQGKLTGEIIVSDPVGNMVVDTRNLAVKDLWFDNDSLSSLAITGKYVQKTGDITYNVNSNDSNFNFVAQGSYRLKDSTGTPIYNKITLNQTDVHIARRFLKTIFSDISGTAVGELEIFGNTKKQFFTGDISITDTLALTVGFTNVKYKIPKARLHFGASEIDFSNQYLYDTLQDRGYISRGYIYHDGFFKKMSFDIDMSSDTMILLNTTRVNNKVFYGYARGDVRMKMYGPDTDMRMDITMKQPQDASVSIVSGQQSRTLGKADFVVFNTLGREMATEYSPPVNNLVVNMDLNVTPKAEIKLIIDDLAGDNISARGNGNLQLAVSSKGDISLDGNYIVESGQYAFSLQSWIKKTFAIERGSWISWSGDPLRAQIGIDAYYVAKDVNLKTFAGTLLESAGSASSKTDLKVTAELREDLSKPKIKFRIGYADNDNSNQSRDVFVQNALSLLSNSEDELNRQVAFLILFDRLLPYEQNSGASLSTGGGISGVDYTLNTISGFIAGEASRYFQNLIEKIFGKGKGWDVDIDFRTYSPGNLTINTDNSGKRGSSDLKISKSWLDDRLTVRFVSNIDFGLGANQTGQVSLAFLPNVIVEYKLNPNGTVIATVFHRQVLDILESNAEKRLSTGAGVVFRKEGDNISDILPFGRKKKKKTIPPPQPLPATTSTDPKPGT